MSCMTNDLISTIEFGNCVPAMPVVIQTTSAPPAKISCKTAGKPKDMETTMNTVAIDTTLNARRHISSAIYSVQTKVECEALKKFGLVESRCPQTAEELVEWIKADDFILPKVNDEDYDESDYKYDKFLGLTFPPKIKRDRTGFEKFMDDFRKEKSSLELEVQVLEPADALKNFKKFESKWIH